MKDPLDNGRTSELPLDKMPPIELAPGDKVTVGGLGEKDGEYEVTGPEFKSTLTEEQIKVALEKIGDRAFEERYSRLGKMVNCQVCRRRHRQFEFGLKGCEQTFTYRIGDYEYFREDENGEKVPDLRTAVKPDQKPTMKQIMGRAQSAKKRFHPHPSKIKLRFIERTRVVFEREGFYLLDQSSEKFKALSPEVQKDTLKYFEEDLHRARIIAAREIRREREFADREVRRRQDQSRRINRGLKVKERA